MTSSINLQLGIGECPECNRQVKNGMCGEHGKVEGVYDLRTKAVLHNGSEIRELLLDAEQTCQVTGRHRPGKGKRDGSERP